MMHQRPHTLTASHALATPRPGVPVYGDCVLILFGRGNHRGKPLPYDRCAGFRWGLPARLSAWVGTAAAIATPKAHPQKPCCTSPHEQKIAPWFARKTPARAWTGRRSLYVFGTTGRNPVYLLSTVQANSCAHPPSASLETAGDLCRRSLPAGVSARAGCPSCLHPFSTP